MSLTSTGLRIASELRRKDADSQTISATASWIYGSYKVNYNFNMVAIDNFTPRQVGLQDFI